MGWLQFQFPRLAISLLSRLTPATLALSLAPKQKDFLLTKVSDWVSPCLLTCSPKFCPWPIAVFPSLWSHPNYSHPYTPSHLALLWTPHGVCSLSVLSNHIYSACILLLLLYWYTLYYPFNMLYKCSCVSILFYYIYTKQPYFLHFASQTESCTGLFTKQTFRKHINWIIDWVN